MLQVLETVENEEVKTQVHVFSEHKEEDAEEFSHRYDNIRIEMEYPLLTPLPFWSEHRIQFSCVRKFSRF